MEWISYIWLVYVPFNLFAYLPPRRLYDWLWLALGAVFVAVYIAVAELPRYRVFLVPMELMICAVFSLFALNNYMIIFPAWQVAFILAQTSRGHRVFRWFAGIYELIIVASFVRYSLAAPSGFSWDGTELVGAVFPVVSPFMAYFFAREIFASRLMRQTNRRLEAVVQRDERERIARDLHDTLGQSFSMITVKAELAKKLMDKAPERVGAELEDIQQTSRKNLQLVREIVNDLHQQSISEMLVTQNAALNAANVAMVTFGENEAEQWPTEIQASISAVLQEALTNVIRHAHAGKVTVGFNRQSAQYEVTIQDDGDGQLFERPGSNGISGMQNRLSAIGGHFSIRSNRIGTLVTCELPEEEKS
ncbi:MAG: sensor histidine kinase [Lactobacillus sp.]|jgi:two-component system sensor histidine kinase DesK|nr:sensor histidine kinase [Lactobacillus sp.]MCI2033321.1 sensor histidine kinase [Lactobacillus sp.]